jgi:hypothetical protein
VQNGHALVGVGGAKAHGIAARECGNRDDTLCQTMG